MLSHLIHQVCPFITYSLHVIVMFPFSGNFYFSDGNYYIRKVTVATDIITSIAGNGGTGSFSGDGGAATSAGLYQPLGLVVDASGTPQTCYLFYRCNLFFSFLLRRKCALC